MPQALLITPACEEVANILGDRITNVILSNTIKIRDYLG